MSDYPAATPNQVIKFLQDFLVVIDAEIDKAVSEDKLRVLSQITQDLGNFMQWLDNAHTGQTPRGPVQLLKDMMNGLTPDSRVIACPRADYNYSILDLGQHIKGLVQRFVPLSKQPAFDEHIATPIKLILFPRIERDNVLTHAIFGHELGHPIATEFLTKEAGERLLAPFKLRSKSRSTLSWRHSQMRPRWTPQRSSNSPPNCSELSWRFANGLSKN